MFLRRTLVVLDSMQLSNGENKDALCLLKLRRDVY